ncbi:ribosome recycling factor [Acetobacterium wieringae]|jgi:ribosome recycling factor|uniref:Ribosome-recycling factor n=1 Tax=Acetobacterium wieringae TaxID=52694 RepID=A0A1F2PEK9_9FIRM|nr:MULTISPECIES: ribosome recycling factor [Acetobacterium]MEA4804828.1 ribosome recycling factor [Acetobacterium wieringae]OFV69485.1 ribosome-recycling factor [Acetobacterium wieringae]OXS26220.1 MAG: ribosome recycling factor [Acetobacterium sp. MES1]TYC87146.1 ribosome recycling factor [Acetobacterium wieringae]URN86079.1 ribosome recycling factor [Acetobacterium wieringae]
MVNEIKATANEKMDKALKNLNESLGSLRAGRANPRILDKVMVDYYGSPTSLNQLANISTPEPRMIVVSPYDATAIPAIEKGILKSDLGFNPSNDGKIIRLLIPQLTEERRKELVKLVKKYGEECKVAMRNIRRHAIQDLKDGQKEGLITEDDLKQGEKEIQKVTDEEIKNIDAILKEKEAEILEV